MPAFSVLDLGLIDYQECLLLQKDLSGRVFEGKSQSSLILCRHNPVITLGRRAKRENILSPEKLASLGIGVIDTNRGGDVTLHLPGQLVIYPVFDLRVFGRDIGCFLRALEQAALLLLADYGIAAKRGIRARRGVGRRAKDCFHRHRGQPLDNNPWPKPECFRKPGFIFLDSALRQVYNDDIC